MTISTLSTSIILMCLFYFGHLFHNIYLFLGSNNRTIPNFFDLINNSI